MAVAFLALSYKENIAQRDVVRWPLELQRKAMPKNSENDRPSRPFWVQVNHDLWQPVQGLVYLSSALSGQDFEVGQQRQIDGIVQGITELETMLRHLGKLVHLEEGLQVPQMQAVKISPLIQAVIQKFTISQQQHEAPIQWQEIEDKVLIDPALMEMILFDLLLNAYHLSDNGTISLSSEKQSKKLVLVITVTAPDSISHHKMGAFVTLSHPVSDKIKASNKASKTTKHFTAMGMVMIQRYAKLLGYEILLLSPQENQKQFKIILPLA